MNKWLEIAKTVHLLRIGVWGSFIIKLDSGGHVEKKDNHLFSKAHVRQVVGLCRPHAILVFSLSEEVNAYP